MVVVVIVVVVVVVVVVAVVAVVEVAAVGRLCCASPFLCFSSCSLVVSFAYLCLTFCDGSLLLAAHRSLYLLFTGFFALLIVA